MLALSLVLMACGAPAVKPADIERTELTAIRTDFVTVVEEARRDPAVEWQSGWLGNLAVHMDEGKKAGLCWQWQELVFLAVRPRALSVGWEIGGIGINVGTYYEHQAVLVWDPQVVSREHVLAGKKDAWVLDAWDRGEPDVFRLDDWLAQFFITFEDLQFVDLSHLDDDLDDAAPTDDLAWP